MRFGQKGTGEAAAGTAGDDGRTALEVAVLWRDELVSVQHFPAGSVVTAGDRPGCAVFLPAEHLGGEQVALAVPDGRAFRVDVATPGVGGDCLIAGRILPVASMGADGRLSDGRWLRVDETTRLRLRYGPFTLMISLSELPARPAAARWRLPPLREQSWTLLSIALHVAFLGLVTLVPEDQTRASHDPYDHRTPAFRRVQVASLDRSPPADAVGPAHLESRPQGVERVYVPSASVSVRVVRAPAGVPVGVGPAPTRVGPRARDSLSSVLASPGARVSRVAGAAVAQVVSQWDQLLPGGPAGTGGRGPSGASADGGGGDRPGRGGGIRVIGSMGAGPGVALEGSLGVFDGGIGGSGGPGGVAGNPAPFGQHGMWFAGSAGGPASEFRAVPAMEGPGMDPTPSRIRGKDLKRLAFHDLGIQVTARPVTVTQGLDRDTVRRYVERRMDQVRWCYQQAVQRRSDLAGELVVEWLITPMGAVAGAKVASSTLGEPSVDACVVDRIGAWVFPAPPGGGAVRVRYPLVFRVTR